MNAEHAKRVEGSLLEAAHLLESAHAMLRAATRVAGRPDLDEATRAVWRAVDAAGLVAEAAGWPKGLFGLEPTGRGFRVVRGS